MAFAHPHSCECAKSELDIFSVPLTQTSVDSAEWIAYNPVATVTEGVPIEFNVSSGGNDYIDLAHTRLSVAAKIVRNDGTDLQADDQVGPINLTLHSIFSDVEIKLGDKAITSPNNTYPYRAIIETLLSYGLDAKLSQLQGALYYKDTAGQLEEHNPIETAATGQLAARSCPNRGLRQRYEFFTGGKVCEMVGTIHSDLFFQNKYLPPDISMRIKLIRAKNAFCLMAGQNATYKLKIESCKLFVRKVKVSDSVYLAHAKSLQSGNALYPIKRVICKTTTIPANQNSYVHENLFTGQIPTRLVIGMVDNDAFNGVYNKNPFHFKHYSLNYIKVYIDGQGQHVNALQPDFENNRFLDAYMSLFSGTGKLQQNEGIDLARREYNKGYSLYAFDLTPDLAEDGHFNLLREGSVRLDVRFATALPNTINIVAYAEFENVLEIDRHRNVITEFGS